MEEARKHQMYELIFAWICEHHSSDKDLFHTLHEHFGMSKEELLDHDIDYLNRFFAEESAPQNPCVISAIFSSYWDGDIVISSPCKVNMATGQITEIKKFTGEVNVDSLDRECVEIDGKEHEVFHTDERTPGQFCFWYDE